MNKFYYFALCAGLFISAFPGCSDEEDDKNDGSPLEEVVDASSSYLKFTILSDTEAELTGITKESANITIPEKVRINGNIYTITSIGYEAFEDYLNIEKVELPNTIRKIGDEAFESCTGLKSINIPFGVVSIGFDAFEDCENLINITIPSTVMSIGEEAFDNCTNLNIVIDNKKENVSVGDYAFSGCKSVKFLK